jgi:hypothetical protein
MNKKPHLDTYGSSSKALERVDNSLSSSERDALNVEQNNDLSLFRLVSILEGSTLLTLVSMAGKPAANFMVACLGVSILLFALTGFIQALSGLRQ